MREPRAVALALALAVAAGCAPQSTSPSPTTIVASQPPAPSPTTTVITATPTRAPATPAPTRKLTDRDLAMVAAERLVGSRVKDTLSALARRDGPALAGIAHPTKGVRFSPHAFVRPGQDQVLTATDLAIAFTSASTRTWGFTDGRGDAIVLTYRDYHARYVYDRDFASAKWTAYNHAIGSGNTIDNSADVYPDAVMFEAYDPGPDPALSDVQWRSLRLIYERSGERWYLVGVVHAEWAI